MVGSIQQPQAQAWYNPYLPQISMGGVQAQSPQAPENRTLDFVELTLKSVYTGRIASVAAMKHVENNFSFHFNNNNNLNNAGLMAKSAGTAAKSGALFSGGISVVRNLVHLAQGDVNLARASGNISADIAGGALSGLVAGASAGMTVGAVSNATPFITGTLGTIMGAIGFAVADAAYNATGLREFVSDKITSLIEGPQQSSIPGFQPNPN